MISVKELVSKLGVPVPPIAIIGEIKAGKGVYAAELRATLPYELECPMYSVPSFSVKMVALARDLFAAPDEMDGRPNRPLLQDIAEAMRAIDPAVWAKYLIRTIEREGWTPFIAEGFRDPEELKAFKDAFESLLVIKIEATLEQRQEAHHKATGRYLTPAELEHPAERGIRELKADLTLPNPFTMEGMQEQINEIIEAIKNKNLKELLRRYQ